MFVLLSLCTINFAKMTSSIDTQNIDLVFELVNDYIKSEYIRSQKKHNETFINSILKMHIPAFIDLNFKLSADPTYRTISGVHPKNRLLESSIPGMMELLLMLSNQLLHRYGYPTSFYMPVYYRSRLGYYPSDHVISRLDLSVSKYDINAFDQSLDVDNKNKRISDMFCGLRM